MRHSSHASLSVARPLLVGGFMNEHVCSMVSRWLACLRVPQRDRKWDGRKWDWRKWDWRKWDWRKWDWRKWDWSAQGLVMLARATA